MKIATKSSARKAILTRRAIWRWHFYAGLFCAPIVIVLSITGTIYLFKPQVESWLDRPYNHLYIEGPRLTVNQQVDAAVRARPGARFKSIEVRPDPTDAARVTISTSDSDFLVMVHPGTGQIMKVQTPSDAPMEIVKTVHGELLMGQAGSILVELGAGWAIVMIVTGLVLWWPRGAQGLGGTVWPRLDLGGRIVWRDLHAVTGVWISSLALFLLITGLPWTTVWNAGFKEVRRMTATDGRQQEWTQSRSSELSDAHADHMGRMAMGTSMSMTRPDLDRLVLRARSLNLPPPVSIVAPSKNTSWQSKRQWTLRSETQNRPRRVTLSLDPVTAEVIGQDGFAAKHPIDKVIAFGIAAHEGQLFGPLNQALGALTALGLVTLSVSSWVLWWRRRPEGRLGAPERLTSEPAARGMAVALIVLGLLLPVLGASMILVGLVERLVLRRVPVIRNWLGLTAPRNAQA